MLWWPLRDPNLYMLMTRFAVRRLVAALTIALVCSVATPAFAKKKKPVVRAEAVHVVGRSARGRVVKAAAEKPAGKTRLSHRGGAKKVEVVEVKARPHAKHVLASHKRGTKRHTEEKTATPQMSRRVHAWVNQSRAAAEKKPAVEKAADAKAAVVADAKPSGKATSADFLRAAAGDEKRETGVSRPDEDDDAGPAVKTKVAAVPVASVKGRAETAVMEANDDAKPVTVAKNMKAAAAKVTGPAKTVAEKIANDDDVQDVASPVMVPALYTKRGRLIVPKPMKGSREILVHQNEMADAEGLDRIEDDDDLAEMRAHKLLVAIPASGSLRVDERLPANRRYCRPWTAKFLTDMARAHYARFKTPMQVNSAVRTVAFQARLLRTNGNAAPVKGETASPHLTGGAVDLAKHGLSLAEIAWMRGYLLPLVQAGKVDVEEEFQQACFHISVYKKYMPVATPKRDLAGGGGRTAASGAMIAAAGLR